jgi:hypothetical protein
MLKTVMLLVAGLAAGFAIAYFSGPSSGDGESLGVGSESRSFTGAGREPAGGDAARGTATAARVASLENTLNQEIQQRAVLEQRVAELGAALDGLRGADAVAEAPASRERNQSGPADAGAQAGRSGPPPGGNRGMRGQETREERIQRLVDAGFPADRAESIESRTSELTMQTIQAQYQRRRGEKVDPALLDNPDEVLRLELGEAEYERYLTALGRPTKVGVFNVLQDSPAEQAGLRSGDEILSYGGQRVFGMRELNNLTVEGTPGEPVMLEVERAGQRLQLVMPRGPIGIGGGPFGGR